MLARRSSSCGRIVSTISRWCCSSLAAGNPRFRAQQPPLASMPQLGMMCLGDITDLAKCTQDRNDTSGYIGLGSKPRIASWLPGLQAGRGRITGLRNRSGALSIGRRRQHAFHGLGLHHEAVVQNTCSRASTEACCTDKIASSMSDCALSDSIGDFRRCLAAQNRFESTILFSALASRVARARFDCHEKRLVGALSRRLQRTQTIKSNIISILTSPACRFCRSIPNPLRGRVKSSRFTNV